MIMECERAAVYLRWQKCFKR